MYERPVEIIKSKCYQKGDFDMRKLVKNVLAMLIVGGTAVVMVNGTP